MHQSWGKLLFMHWPIDAELLRPLIPSQLEIDIFDGRAWIGAVYDVGNSRFVPAADSWHERVS